MKGGLVRGNDGSWREQIAYLRGRTEGASEVLHIWNGVMEELLLGSELFIGDQDSRKLVIGAMVSARNAASSLLEELSIELELLSQSAPRSD